MPIEEGKAAPAFTLPNASGEKASLKDFRGKQVILYFYPKDDTPSCTKEAQAFRDLWPEFQRLDAVVRGISPDSSASHAECACEFELPFPLLADADEEGLTAYEAFGEKTVYGKKVMGVIRS